MPSQPSLTVALSVLTETENLAEHGHNVSNEKIQGESPQGSTSMWNMFLSDCIIHS